MTDSCKVRKHKEFNSYYSKVYMFVKGICTPEFSVERNIWNGWGLEWKTYDKNTWASQNTHTKGYRISLGRELKYPTVPLILAFI